MVNPLDSDIDKQTLLEFDDVTFSDNDVYDSSVSQISFTLKNGDLAIVLLEKEHICLPLADLAAGIVTPDKGEVRFQGSDWKKISPDAAAIKRGSIGRVFEGNPWLDDLEVHQNIMLSQLHHTRRPFDEIARQAAELSRVFGLPGLPFHLPSTFRGKDLARCACVRAFMGNPKLVVLERPTHGVYPEILPSLLNVLRVVRSQGAAVLWLTDNTAVWNNPGVRPTLKAQMYGARVHVDTKEPS
ncbi:ABC-type transport system involved in resitance to organic solvents, ATP-binding protein [Desulforapulum autotrophicum HRM2]|uniref:ABC-type transport system involved in resitance to organic solvents, ATP-binding protein n=1 Tax=Desulforapulum autotrophicum (strain ATCC 43914 / DSM 3382 / VKM B-1955 / HRM2) TaxID=177437 RepID=C0QFX0_DESAH|nr:ABC-type transport system involved in resitance to organic solvents, ATP-binding protein [Desulforapulum autotrophicum]ACN15538.1 ABC-type transport system involved in resitance to organic solvents, ATP-binding protein [Desulforapulum autotrophicum HRM2]